MFRMLKDPKVIWEPKSDITAYELAQAIYVIALSANSSIPKRWIIDLPDSVQRHFKCI